MSLFPRSLRPGLLRSAALVFLLLTLAPRAVSAQATEGARAFSLYLDCSGFYCESDFYRTDIVFVDHVRDRTAADVHVLITRQKRAVVARRTCWRSTGNSALRG